MLSLNRWCRSGARQLSSHRLLSVGFFLAIVSCLLVSCGNAPDPVSRAHSPATVSGAVVDGGSTLNSSVPGVISHAVAQGMSASPTPRHPTTTPRRQENTFASSSQGTGQASVDPSGENPPSALPGFTLTYVQDFGGNGIPPNWDAYNGVPGGVSSSVARWVPSMCTFSGGAAHFLANGIDSCGLQYYGDPQIYGAWFARLKGDSQPSDVFFSNIFLLFPASNQWPPEIDIYEDGGGRSSTSASVYNTVGNICGSSPTSQCLRPYAQSNGGSGGVRNNDTEWHTYSVEWTPSGVTWLIDGNVIYTALASQVKSPARQPAVPMYMDLQSQNVQGPGAPKQRENMTVDWVEEYKWNG
jgi:hypothetical protein